MPRPMVSSGRGLIIETVPDDKPFKALEPLTQHRDTWSQTMRELTDMTAEEFAAECKVVAKEFRQYGKIKIRKLMAMVAIKEFVNNPTPGLWNTIMDRMEGKVAESVNLNQVQAIQISIRKVEDAKELPPAATKYIDAESTTDPEL